MPTVIGHHDVKDTDHWLASPKREEVFGPLGVTNIRTFVNPQNRTQVAVLMDVADLDVVMAAMQNPAKTIHPVHESDDATALSRGIAGDAIEDAPFSEDRSLVTVASRTQPNIVQFG